MAGTISTDLVLIDAAEATTAWATHGTWGAAPAASADIYLEQSNAINARASAANGPVERYAASMVATSSNLDLTTASRHLYFWIKCFSLPALQTRAKGGIRIGISSDTTPTRTPATVGEPWVGPSNSKNWFVTGKDFEPESGWVCYVIDPTGVSDYDIGSPAMGTVNRAGIEADALLVVGGGAVKPLPTMWDRIAYGSKLTINDGTGGVPVTLEDIYAADSANGTQYGILRKAVGLYLAAGKLVFGTTGQTAITYFKDINQVIVWQDFRQNESLYEIKMEGAGSFATTFQLGNYSGGLASGGCVVRGGGLNSRRAVAPVIVSGGTGYTAGDTLSVTGGTYTVQAQCKVITVSGGVITDLKIETAGAYSVPPTGTLSLTGGTGSSATCTLTFVGGAIWTLTCGAANTVTNIYGCSFSEMKSATFGASDTLRGNTFDNFGNIVATGALIDNCTFQNLRTTTPISATYAVDAVTTVPTLTNCKFVNCATALRWPMAFDPNGKLDGTTFTSGGTGHAIEFTGAATSRTLTNVTFTGYSGTSTNAAVYVNIASGTMTLTIAGTGTDITGNVRTAGATVTVVAGTKTVKVVVSSTAGAVTGANVFLAAAAGGPFPSDAAITSITRGTTTATVTHAAAHGMATDDQVNITGITDKIEDNIVHTITYINPTQYSYTTTDSGSTNYTGTIKGTFVFLKGLATAGANGNEISMSRAIPSSQPVTGWARKSTSAPYYKEGAISGTVSSTADTTFGSILIGDD